MKKPVVVIGAGMGGLTAAVELAAAGEEVLVVEAGAEVGGKLGRAVVDGVEFDTGPSVVTMTDVIESVFEAGGTRASEELELFSPDHVFEYRWSDGMVLPFHGTWEATRDSVGEVLGAEAAQEFANFMGYARGIWEAAAPNFVYGDAPNVGRAVKLGVTKFRELMKIDPMRSMQGAIEARVRDRRLRDVLLRYATYNGSDPRVAPATLNCIAWVELGLGCYGIRGGMYELARALERVARRHGVRFEFGVPVARVEGSRRIEAVVLADGRRVETDRVVCNADVAHLVGELMPGLKGVSAPATLSMSGWNAVVRAKRRERPSHAVLFPERAYLEEFVDIFDRDRPPEEPTLYLCAQERAHGREGWAEHEPLFVMANAPAESSVRSKGAGIWLDFEGRVLQKLRDAVLIDAEDVIVWRRNPADLAAAFPGSAGSIYGAASNTQLAAFQRPSNRVRGVEGLYLASGSAHPGGGVPMCMLSGRAAARALLG